MNLFCKRVISYMSEEYERDVYVRIIGNMTKQLYNDLFSIKEEIDIIKMPKYCYYSI